MSPVKIHFLVIRRCNSATIIFYFNFIYVYGASAIVLRKIKIDIWLNFNGKNPPLSNAIAKCVYLTLFVNYKRKNGTILCFLSPLNLVFSIEGLTLSTTSDKFWKKQFLNRFFIVGDLLEIRLFQIWTLNGYLYLGEFWR